MLISGLQKLTLLDYPGKVACTVFTGGCNFRCPFCHNASLVIPGRISHDSSEEAVLSFLAKRRGILDGVAVTGGEPLIHADITEFLGKIKDMGFLVKLDTNGAFPDRLMEIVKAGLADRVAMDIKNSPELYEKTVGVSIDMADIERSKDFLLEGSVEYEFRTTVVKGLHTAESIAAAAEWIKGAGEYYLQQFKDSGDLVKKEGLSAFNEEEMESLRRAALEFVPATELRGL